MTTCPFCGHDPFHYVHNGLGMEAVAVTCCDLGVELYNRDPAETVTMDRADFMEVAQKLYLLRSILDAANEVRDAVDARAEGQAKQTEKAG